MKKKIILVGNDHDVIDIIDNQKIYTCVARINKKKINDKEELKKILKKYPKANVVITIDNPKVRKKLFSIYKNYLINLKSKESYISKKTKFLKGNVIQKGVNIMPNVSIGNCCNININASIHHDSKIGNFVTIAPGVTILGSVKIKDGAYIGAGAIIKQNCIIEENSVVGAGAVVIKNVPKNKTVIGIPAKILKN